MRDLLSEGIKILVLAAVPVATAGLGAFTINTAESTFDPVGTVESYPDSYVITETPEKFQLATEKIDNYQVGTTESGEVFVAPYENTQDDFRCELALEFPDYYNRLSNEEKSSRALDGYDPKLYCTSEQLDRLAGGVIPNYE